MKLASSHEFSKQQKKTLKKAHTIEYISILHMSSVVLLMYLVMGSSQAMKTAWVEDILSLIPPLVFLITCKFRNKKPNKNFQYGFHRVVSFGFFISAISLLVMGVYLAIDSSLTLINQDHPSIGLKSFFGRDIWLGWWMLLVLAWGSLPPVVFGHIKKKLSKPLHNKVLYTDGDMNKADWQTGLATMLGVLGIGFGYWWTDAVAALFISINVLKDGLKHTKDGFTELMNRSPKNLEGDYLHLPDEVEKALEDDDEILSANARMYEHGHVIFGDVFIKTQSKKINEDKIKALQKKIHSLDWRLNEVTITLDTD